MARRLPLTARLLAVAALASSLALGAQAVAFGLVGEQVASWHTSPPSCWLLDLTIAALGLGGGAGFLLRREWARKLLIASYCAVFLASAAELIPPASSQLVGWEGLWTLLPLVYRLAAEAAVPAFVASYLCDESVTRVTRPGPGAARPPGGPPAAPPDERRFAAPQSDLPLPALVLAVGVLFRCAHYLSSWAASGVSQQRPIALLSTLLPPVLLAIVAAGPIGLLRRQDWGRRVLSGVLIAVVVLGGASWAYVLVLMTSLESSGFIFSLDSPTAVVVALPEAVGFLATMLACVSYLRDPKVVSAMRRRGDER